MKVRIVFETDSKINWVIVGELLRNNSTIEGHCFDSRRPREAWHIELFKAI